MRLNTPQSLERGSVEDFASATRLTGFPCFFVEEVLWSASLAVVPMLEYADISPFREARIHRSSRLLHAYLTLWFGPVHPPEFPGMRADVL
jgi:hypothetical protein